MAAGAALLEMIGEARAFGAQPRADRRGAGVGRRQRGQQALDDFRVTFRPAVRAGQQRPRGLLVQRCQQGCERVLSPPGRAHHHWAACRMVG
ncbi:MAG: hypothetical protein ABI641_15680, partial [Caldimonas sp.]